MDAGKRVPVDRVTRYEVAPRPCREAISDPVPARIRTPCPRRRGYPTPKRIAAALTAQEAVCLLLAMPWGNSAYIRRSADHSPQFRSIMAAVPSPMDQISGSSHEISRDHGLSAPGPARP